MRSLEAACLVAAVIVPVPGCGNGDPAPSGHSAPGHPAPGHPAPGEPTRTIFEPWDLGLDFKHHTGSEGNLAMPGIMGGGVAVFDYDGDDSLDLYFVESGERLPGTSDTPRSPNRLYRQEPDGRFVDVTETSGTGDRGYGMGTALGDIDNDGDLDLLVTNLGEDVLLRNEGDGSFRDITSEAGVGTPGWSMSAVFFDYDRDGWLDLYVTRYVRFDASKTCRLENGRPEYCGPTAFPGVHDVLYQNLGGAGFRDVTADAGMRSVALAGLGVVAADWNGDGWVDVYVANDADPNNLWVNKGDGTFSDQAVMLGVANNRLGAAEAGMGVATNDIDGDGYLDLFVTHLIEESNTFYRSLGRDGFTDETAAAGLAGPSFDLTGFGTALFDYDNDGDLDVAVANGAVKRRAKPFAGTTDWFLGDYAEPNLLFSNSGDGEFASLRQHSPEEQSPQEQWCAQTAVSRGLIAADLDADGGQDLVVTNLEGSPEVYRNVTPPAPWIDVRVTLPKLHRDARGATLVAHTATSCLVRPVLPRAGYLASGPAQVHLGLGEETAVERFLVRWLEGGWESFPGAEGRQTVELKRGAGTALANTSPGESPCAL